MNVCRVGFVLAVVAGGGCGASSSAGENDADAAKLNGAIEKLVPIHARLGKPQPGEWLYQHRESGQTFAEYRSARPVTPTGRRRVIYVQPLGEFSEGQRKIVELTADYMGRYFHRDVKILEDLPMSVVPARARRTHPSWKVKQILSTYVLRELLPPRLPKDAAAMLALTATDLWPGEGWNFVFGQASLRNRVGVWSIYRNGDADAGTAEFRQCLLRTLKTAVHETGHMFSMKHCTAYDCVMCGSNSLGESDRRQLAACPQCMAKTCWATGADPADRLRRLAEFCREQRLSAQQEFFEKSLARIAR